MSPGSCQPVRLLAQCWCPDLPPGTCSGGLCWVGRRSLHRSTVHSPMRGEGPAHVQHSQDPQDRSTQPGWPQATASLPEQGLDTPVPLSDPARLPENKTKANPAWSFHTSCCPHPQGSASESAKAPTGTRGPDTGLPFWVTFAWHLRVHQDFKEVQGAMTSQCCFLY